MYNRTLLPERLLINITILVPNGTTQHGNERLLCLPITSGYWPSISSVIIFFAANYLAHAATVKSSPGDATLVQACNAFLALMFPMSGLLRALNAMFRYSRSAKTALEKACNAGALCMVVRDRHWQPERPSDVRVRVVHRFEEVHDEPHIYADWTTYLPSYAREKPSSWVHFDSVWAQSYVNPRLKRIHGTFALPEGYTFAIVPRDTFLLAKGAPNRRGDNCSVSDISASTSSLKAVASMVQIIAAFTTLLSHRSDLTGRWGYASYHLTVIPYLFMTLVNLVSNLIIADYPCLYMVRTDTMAEAERAGGIFEAEVAQTVTLTDEDVDLNEDAPYGGITIEKIVSFVTTFTSDWMIFWPLVSGSISRKSFFVAGSTQRLIGHHAIHQRQLIYRSAKIQESTMFSNFPLFHLPLQLSLMTPSTLIPASPMGTSVPDPMIWRMVSGSPCVPLESLTTTTNQNPATLTLSALHRDIEYIFMIRLKVWQLVGLTVCYVLR
ncbi:hypothetical protein D6C76_03061 [Aureobasidium pullulans]|nr:hypothetical protein D6C76_03061 [Aureobasidium pullulans]